MRIGFVSQWFDPEGGSAAVPGTIARALSNAGNDVEVLTGFPNYPNGKIFPGIKQHLHKKDVVGNLNVHRVPLYPNHSNSALKRTAGYFSFALTSTLIGMPALRKIDTYFVYSTPVLMGFGPMVAGWLRRKPVLTFVPDIWPDSMVASGIADRSKAGKALKYFAQKFSNLAYNHSSALVCTSLGIQQTLIQRGAQPERTSVVYNWVDETRFHPEVDGVSKRRELNLADQFIVMYAGNLGTLQDVTTIIEASKLLVHRQDISFVFAGAGTFAADIEELANSASNVRYLGNMPIEDMPALIAASDVQIMSLVRHPLFEFTIPSKLQFSTASGRPLIAAMVGEAADMVEEFQAGIVIAPGSPEDMQRAIASLADLPSQDRALFRKRSRELYESQFCETVGIEKLTSTLQTIAR